MPAVKCCIFRAPAGNREVCQLPHTFHERHRDECVQMQDRQLKINIEKRKHATTDPYCTKFPLSNGILNKCVSNFYFFPSRQIFQVLKHAFLENPPLCDVSTGQKFFWSPESCVAAFFVSFSGKLKLSLFLQEASNRGLSVLELNKKTYIKTRSEKNVHNPEPLRHQRDAKPEVIVSSSFSTLQQSTQTLDDRQTLCIGGRWGDGWSCGPEWQSIELLPLSGWTDLISITTSRPDRWHNLAPVCCPCASPWGCRDGRAAVTFAKSGGSAPVVLEFVSSHLSLMAKRRAIVKGL